MKQASSTSQPSLVGLCFLVIGAIGLVTVIVSGFHIGYQAIFLCCIIIGAWKSIIQNPGRSLHATELETDHGDEDPDSPMISFVLLQREQRFMEDVVLAKIIQAAWGGDYAGGDVMSEQEENQADGFVVGESPLFVVKSPSGAYMIHNFDQPYWDSMDEVTEQIGELRLRKAVSEHQAWLSVDLIAPSDENQTPSQQYSLILKLVLELADEGTLAILRPETMEINVWSDDLAARLTEPDAYTMFAEPDNAPVVPIADDDPDMQAAVATAKHRWPEFVAAYENRVANPMDDDAKFNVKAKISVGDSTEFIWLDVIGLEPHYVHGRLANDPVDLGDLKLGSQVEVPIDDVQDWCYIDNDEPIGLFSLEVIRRMQLAQQHENE